MILICGNHGSLTRVSVRYVTVTDGEWIQPIRKGYLMACCDCGLVHRMDFRIVTGRVRFRAYRAARSTAMIRRHRRIRIKGKP